MRRASLFLLAWLLALPAAAGEKVDLTAYLSVFPLLGDFKVHEVSDGSVRREDVVYVDGGPGRWIEVAELRVDGVLVGGSGAVVTAGKKTAIGLLLTQGVTVLFPAPGLKLPLRLVPGAAKRSTAHGRVEVDDRKVGSARWSVERTFVGFEEKVTPLQTFPDTARMEYAGTLRLKSKATGEVLELRSTITSWSVPGLGAVASEEHAQVYLDGVLVEDSGPITVNFVSGQVGGVAFP